MKKIVVIIVVLALCLAFASCKKPGDGVSLPDFNDISVAVNSETGVQAGWHTPLINISDFENYKNNLGVSLNIGIKDQDGNDVLLNGDGQFMVEYDKVYSIIYSLSCEGHEPKNYFATVTALTSDMVAEPPADENKPEEYDYLSFVTIDTETCDVSAKDGRDKNNDYVFTLPKNLIIPAEHNGKRVVAANIFAESAVETVTLPASVIKVETRAFGFCGSLTAINLQAVKEIKKGAFYKCVKLSSVSLDAVEIIGEEAFMSCSGLAEIDIGKNAVSIGYNAFKNCIGLKRLTIRSNTVVNLTDTYLSNIDGVTVYVPEALLSYYQSQNPAVNFSAII